MLGVRSLSVSTPPNESGSRSLFRELSFDLDKGQSLGVIGPNGCGKSTLLKCIVGISPNYTGNIVLPPSSHVRYLPQNYRNSVLSWISLEEHFQATLVTKDKREKALEFLDKVGFRPQQNHKMANLSGGELQLVLLATVLRQDCNLLLLDEPLSAVDFVRRGLALVELQKEIIASNKSMVMVSHHLDDAKKVCNSLIALSGQPGSTPIKTEVTSDLSLEELFRL